MVEINYNDKTRLLSEETFKVIAAMAWESNTIKADKFRDKLADALVQAERIHGIEFAMEMSKAMNGFWDAYQKHRKEQIHVISTPASTKVKCHNGMFYTEEKEEASFQIISAAKLSKEPLPPIRYAIENMIPEGETVISAPFKSGKSWLVMEMCMAVSRGEQFMGFKTQKGSTVYFALEDCDKFAQERINMLPGDVPDNFYYIFQARTLDDGLLDMLDSIYEQIEDVRMIVIDTLAFIEFQPKRGESAYKTDYRTGSTLKKWADAKGISIVVVTHTTKVRHMEDPFMNTSGTNGVTAAADSIITIVKEKRSDQFATLAVTGRRVRESFHRIQMDEHCVWQNMGTLSSDGTENLKQEEERRIFEASDIRKAVLEVADQGDFRGKARDLKEAAEEIGIYLLEDAKEIGGFLHRYQNYFIRFENVKVTIISNGNAPKIYKIQVWEKLDRMTEKTIEDH